MKNPLPLRALSIFAVLLVCASLLVLPTSAETSSASYQSATDAPTSQIVAYYFHGNMRCGTCRKLEAYSDEAITEGFTDELASGRLSWLAVNTDESENKHFVKDFELVTKSLVLVEYRDGKVARFENLKLIWELVRDKDGFLKYVRDHTSDFLEAG